jgi:hypothetical protein
MRACSTPDPLEARLAQLEARVAQLEARSGPRDQADVALLAALAASVGGGVTFGAREVFRHARVDRALRAALVAADLVSPRQLGKLLRRMAGEHDGYVLTHVGEDRHGLRWRVLRV